MLFSYPYIGFETYPFVATFFATCSNFMVKTQFILHHQSVTLFKKCGVFKSTLTCENVHLFTQWPIFTRTRYEKEMKVFLHQCDW